MLSAFVHVDAVGSTELLAARGVAATMTARRLVGDEVDAVASRFGGERVATRGDGTLVRFDSAVRAVRFGLDLQDRLATVQVDGVGVPVRAGIALTDVADEPEAMAAASQVESMCPPGGVAVGSAVVRAVRIHLPNLLVEPIGNEVELIRSLGKTNESETSVLRSVLFTEPTAPGGGIPGMTHIDAEGIVAAHGGTVLDSNGLGHVVGFDRCHDGLGAAAALHAAAADVSVSTDEAVRFRIGSAIGELTSSGDSHVGRPVVEAARLAELAEPGSTCVSHDVWWLGGAPASWTHEQAVSLKGFSDTVDVHRSDPDVGPAPLLPLPQKFAADARFELVGRGGAMGVLRRAWEQTCSGTLAAVAVTGLEGVGKTRLVREFVREVHAGGATVLLGACTDGPVMAFAPVAEALSRASSIDPELSAAVEGKGPIASLLGRFAVDGQQSIDRIDLFAAFNNVLGRMCSRRPTILVIDDLQWASGDVTELLTQLLTGAPDMRLLVLVTCRDAEVDREHPVHRFLAASRRRRSIERCALDALSPQSVAAMLASLAGAPLVGTDLEFARHIERISGGNPLYVEELITHFVETGTLVQRDGRWTSTVPVDELSVPETVIELMVARIARLGPDAGRVLGVASVVGSSFDLAVLSDVLGQSLIEILDVIEAAETAGLVVEDDSGGRCTFTDELVRHALLNDVRPTRRALMHQQIGESLERLSPDRVDELAVHWQAAIGTDADLKAVHYLRRAGERDMASAAWESSVERHQRIIELLARMPATADPESMEVAASAHLALGLSTRAIGADGFRPTLMEAGRLAKRVGRGDLLAQAAIAMMRPGAWYPEASMVDEDITTMCEDALLILEPGDPLRARVLAALATNLAYDPDASHRDALIAEAQMLARTSGDPRLVGTTLAAELITARRPDQFGRRAELASEVRRLGHEHDDHDLSITGGIFLVLDAMERGDVRLAREMRSELEGVVDRHRTFWPRFLVAHMDACLMSCEGDPKADDRIDEVYEEFVDQPVDAAGVWTIQMAVRAMQKGTMAELLLPLTEMSQDDADADWAKKWNYAVARAQLDTGNPEAALASIAENPDPDFDNYWMASVQNLGSLGLTMRDDQLCRQAIHLLSPYRGRFAVIGIGACMAAQVSTALGQAHLGLGHVDVAVEFFRESLAQSVAIGSPYFECESSRYLAMALLEANTSNSEAVELLDRVAGLAARHGFALEASAEAELRALVSSPG